MPPWFIPFGKPHYINFGYAQDDTLIFYEAKNRGVKQLIFAAQTPRSGSGASRKSPHEKPYPKLTFVTILGGGTKMVAGVTEEQRSHTPQRQGNVG